MKRLALYALITAAPMIAAAGDEVGHWYINPQVGGISTDSRRDARNDWLYGFGFGKNLTESWSAELNFNDSRVKDKFDPGHLKLYAGSLDVLRIFNRSGTVAPYFSLGAGALRDSPSLASDSTKFMAQAGVGMLLKLWESADASRSFALRPDVKARWDDPGHAGHLVDYIGTLGFQFSFGPATPAPVVAALPPPPASPPAPPPPPAPPVPPAPLDSDNDGVPDDIDQCPGTPPGVAVDAVGCPRKGSITLEGVNFEFNSAVLSAQSGGVLDTLAEGLRKHPRLKIELQGHTDSVGSAQYNMTLSSKRADAVRDYLISQQVPTSQLAAKGYGKTQPIADNATAEGRAHNRRVVMLVLENPGEVKVERKGQSN